ncbi:MAG: alanine racemase [Xanthomonadales bacterium]|nr:alanine racemase [Xanthomonadales bacterium]NNL94470.1 alanine racemase [Xanthomonadales bacterium]
MSRNTVARIDLEALAYNLGVVRSYCGDSQIACVIKADGYGHGIQRVSKALSAADLFAVATPDEAKMVREAGWAGRLLLLEGFSDRDDLALARALGLELVVHQSEQLSTLQELGFDSLKRIWLKLDTGMHRLGFPAEDAPRLLEAVRSIKGAGAPWLMTHFACADEADNPMTAAQIQLFDKVSAGMELRQSLANSAAILNFKDSHRDCVRPGILLYGISPINGSIGEDHGLRPAMSLACELIAINDAREGDRVGYGAAYTCPRDMRIGVAAIGYGDGYPRHLENGTPVLVNGRRAQLAGRVSMDLITIDLSGHDDARCGDEVLLWGPGLPVEEIASAANAIPYELVCGVTGRVDRLNT